MIKIMGIPEARYHGLRMTADEYLALPEDLQCRYELVDGVVLVTPSASFGHQSIAGEIFGQIRDFLKQRSIGRVVHEVDVRLGDDLVYRPDVVYLRADKVDRCGNAVLEPPDLVVEVISPQSRAYDLKTKCSDYEKAGVAEYWVVDPFRDVFHFFVLEDGLYQARKESGGRYESAVLPDFSLDLAAVRRFF